MRKRNLEYLVRSRKLATKLFDLDPKRLSQDPILKGAGNTKPLNIIGKDCYLLELKGYDNSNPANRVENDSNHLHEYFLFYPQGSGKDAGKKVPLNKQNIHKDYNSRLLI